MISDPQNSSSTPPPQASSGAGRGGVVPPVHSRFKPGQSGNPNGSRTYGAAVKAHCNLMREWNADKIKAAVANQRMSMAKRIGGTLIMDVMERPDMADYQPVIDGTMTLEELRKSGVDTRPVKKVRYKKRSFYKDGEKVGDEVEVTIEFHDRAGAAADRLLTQTDGPAINRDIQEQIDELKQALTERSV